MVPPICDAWPVGLIPSVATPAHARNWFAEPRDRAPKITAISTPPRAETARPLVLAAEKPANRGLFVRHLERPVPAGVRGGPERTQTACQARSHCRTGLRLKRDIGSRFLFISLAGELGDASEIDFSYPSKGICWTITIALGTASSSLYPRRPRPSPTTRPRCRFLSRERRIEQPPAALAVPQPRPS